MWTPAKSQVLSTRENNLMTHCFLWPRVNWNRNHDTIAIFLEGKPQNTDN